MTDHSLGVQKRRSTRRRRRVMAGLVSVLVLSSAVAGAPAALASFVDNSVVATSTFGAAPDWVAPQVGATVIAKSVGYLAGSVKQGGTYYVYANVTDTGNPASGVAVGGESADVSVLTSNGASTSLVAGSYSVGGQTYNHRSASLIATTPLAAGTKSYSVSSADVAGNGRTQTGYFVIVDNNAPAASDVQATDGGGTEGRAQAGDTITFTYSEQVDPQSILTGWTGSPTGVVVRVIDGGCLLNLLVKICNDDSVAIHNAANTTQLGLGSVDLNHSDYHGTLLGTLAPLTFGASGTASTMVQSGSTITVTLGTASGTGGLAGQAAMVWTPAATAYDAAGNSSSTSARTETGTTDRDF